MMINSSNESDNFTPRQVGVLVEELRSEFRVFGEGLAMLTERVNGLDKKVEEVRANQTMTLVRITGLKTQMNERFDAVEGRLGRLETTKI